MKIFNHLLPANAVLGIGPLMWELSPDRPSVMVYGSGRYYFELHLVAHTTKIYSDWFYPLDSDTQKDAMKQWKMEYSRARKEIAALIGEPITE